MNCEGIQLEIIGKEKTKWIMPDKKEGNSFTKICGGHNKFFHISHSIHKFENKLALQGQYSFPFTMTLPEWLPQSFL